MSARFEAAFQLIVGAEGGLDLDNADPGNWTGGEVGRGDLRGTKYGWAAADWPGYLAEMPAEIRAQMPPWPDGLTLELAKLAYQTVQWSRIAGDALPAPIALVVFDEEINQGPSAAPRDLQKALGVAQDGVIGPETIKAALERDPVELLAEFGWLRLERYQAARLWSHDGHGWTRRLLSMTARAFTYAQ
ncbi:MAG: hypothetical protein KGL39_33990 [Patescibacteria group bacterium]|nr:hypothetical protein [Patescibacteria group bacterium]